MLTEIRNFKQEDLPLLTEFYHSVTKDRRVIFWWVGPEENWDNVICAFEAGKIVAKGQVEIINRVSEGHPLENRHTIYLNLKTLPDKELDYDLLNKLYTLLYNRALELKQLLSIEYQTNLCVGNFGTEINNNRYFVEQNGYKPLNTLFTMERDLQQSIEPMTLSHPDLQWKFWEMDGQEEEKQYLEVEREIWPDAALGLNRLHEYKANPSWTAIPVLENGSIIASAMAWREEDMGVIEDVFVRENWRRKGIATFLLTTALTYLKDIGLTKAMLMVDTENEKALQLYRSVGFNVIEEERRFFIELT